jgi:hypothetical protein
MFFRPPTTTLGALLRDRLTARRAAVYNAAMDILTALLHTILGGIVETVLEPVEAPPPVLSAPAFERGLPLEAKTGRMLPLAGDGFLTIDRRQWPLAPGAQIRNEQNLIITPMQVQKPVEVAYLTDHLGAVRRVWLLAPGEAAALDARREAAESAMRASRDTRREGVNNENDQMDRRGVSE